MLNTSAQKWSVVRLRMLLTSCFAEQNRQLELTILLSVKC